MRSLTPAQVEACLQDLKSARTEAAAEFYATIAPYIKARVAYRAPDLIRLVLEDDVVQTVVEMLITNERPYRPISEGGQPHGFLNVLVLKAIDRVRAASGQRGGTELLTGSEALLEQGIASPTPMTTTRPGFPQTIMTPVVTPVTRRRHTAAAPLDIIQPPASLEDIEETVIGRNTARDRLSRIHEASPRLAHVITLRAAGVPAREAEQVAGITRMTCARQRARFLAEEGAAA